MNTDIDDLLRRHSDGETFRVKTVTISHADAAGFVRLRRDPKQFKPTLFDGDWGVPTEHPEPGEIKLLTAINDTSGVSRVIAPQGRQLFACPR